MLRQSLVLGVHAEAAPAPLSEAELDAQDPKELQYRRARADRLIRLCCA
jgi:hypothetical protein